MASYDHIPDDIKKEAIAESDAAQKKSSAAQKSTKKPAAAGKPAAKERKQRGLFKKKRAGVILSRDEVKAIKKGRRKLRRELRSRGLKSRRDFNMTAATLGLYFDNRSAFWAWLWTHWLGALIGTLIGLLTLLFIFSIVQQMRGHFTIQLSDGMFRQGFALSDNKNFENATIQLFAKPAQNVPCISINQIPTDIDEIDGEHNDLYFAYTYYIRNEGDSTVGYAWDLEINDESVSVSDAIWIMVFEDGVPRIYAKANHETGEAEALPAKDDNTRGYIRLPVMKLAPESDQFELVKKEGLIQYWRVIPDVYASKQTVASGIMEKVAPGDTHKYTVVMWIEGDDVDATNEIIGGHLGVEMNFLLLEEQTGEHLGGENMSEEDTFFSIWKEFWAGVWDGLKFK